MDGVEIDMNMERMIQEAYDNGYLRGYEKGKHDRLRGEMKSMGTYYKCSACGGEFNDEITFMGELNYCPACGCSWEGDDDD